MIPPRAIVAPVDFSEQSRTALAYAADLATHLRATLHVVYAEDPLLAEGAREAGIDLARDTTEELARFVAGTAKHGDVAAQPHVVKGPAIDGIIQAAQRLRADLIVIGSHGMSGVERVIFGSTTEGVLRKSTIPVLVVPSPA